MEKLSQVEFARRRLEIVRLRNLAAVQRDDRAAIYYRQAGHPIYPGQADVCIGLARQAERLAAANNALADVMEAELAEATNT